MLIYILHNNYKNDSINKLYVVIATSSTSNEVEKSYIYTLTKDSHKASCWSTENHKSIRDLKEVISCIIKNGIFDQFVIKTVDEILGVQYWKFDLDSIDGVIALFATNPFSAYLVYNHLDWFKYEWIWEKDNGSNFVHVKHQPFKVHEQILIFGKQPTTYNKAEKYMRYNPQFIYDRPYKIKRDGSDVTNLAGFNGRTDTDNEDGKRYPRSVQKFNSERGLHPTQKPVALLEYLIKTYTNENDLVLDNCMGSGSTGVACINTNRSFIGIELDKSYFNIAKQRIEILI